MPKRSRSASASSLSSRCASVEAQQELTEIVSAHAPKYFRYSPSPVPDSPATTNRPMQCTLPPHAPIILPSVTAFENHYAQEHTNRCAECGANLPSSWFLELHLSERHDPLIAGLREKGEKTYKCLIPTCERVTSAPQKRRLHLIDKHGYPRNYDFRIIENGIGSRISLLRGSNTNSNTRRRRVSEVGDQNWRTSGRDRGDGRGGLRSRRGTVERTPKDESGINQHEHISIDEGAGQPIIQDDEARPGKRDRLDAEATEPGGKKELKNEDEMDTLMNGMASLKFVPLSVRMKDKGKAG